MENIKWIKMSEKGNRNSTIFHDCNYQYFLKQIKCQPIDFAHMNSNKNEMLQSDKILVWKEIDIVLLYYNFLQKKNLPHIKIHKSELKRKDDGIFIEMISDFVPMNMIEFIKKSENQIRFLSIQLFFQCYYLHILQIKHCDLHAGNIMIRPLPKKKTIKLFYKNCFYFLHNQSFECYIIDFGFSKIDMDHKGVYEFRNFMKKVEKDLQLVLFSNHGHTWDHYFYKISKYLAF